MLIASIYKTQQMLHTIVKITAKKMTDNSGNAKRISSL